MKRNINLQANTMIDLAIGWINIGTVPSARGDLIANQVQLSWLNCYPLPINIIVDSVNKFLAEFREMIINDYGMCNNTCGTHYSVHLYLILIRSLLSVYTCARLFTCTCVFKLISN